jgi:hypothetical protein
VVQGSRYRSLESIGIAKLVARFNQGASEDFGIEIEDVLDL